MAADISAKREALNPCCQVWEEKYKKSQGNRTALRQALKLFEEQLDKIQAENLSLQKARQEELARVAVEKKGKEEALAGRVTLENEISALKSEISILQQKGGSDAQCVEEVKLLEIRVKEREMEIKQLKEELEKEKIRADSEKKNAEVEKKRAAEAEKAKVDEERKQANIEGEKEEKYRLQLDALREEAVDAKSKLVSELSKLGDMSKKLEAEKQKVNKERKRANTEGKKAEEYRLQLDALRKEADDAKSMLVSEASKSEPISKKLEAEKQMASKERKRANIEEKKAEEYRLQLEALRIEADDAKSKLVSEASKSEAISKKLGAEKQMVSKERKRANIEEKKAEEYRLQLESLRMEADDAKSKLVSEASKSEAISKKLDAEKQKASKERKRANIEERKAEEYRLQLEALRIEADDAKSKLVSEASKSEAISKKLEAEKQMVSKERKRADLEMAKVEEQRKLAEASRKQVEEEKHRAESLSQQLEKAGQRIVELQKEIKDLVSSHSVETHAGKPDTDVVFLEMKNGPKVDTLQGVGGETNLDLEIWKFEGASRRFGVDKQKAIGGKELADLEMFKSQEHWKLAEVNGKVMQDKYLAADHLSQQLEEARGRIDKLQKQMHDLHSSRKPFEASAIPADKYLNADSGKVKLLKKQLKFEKMQVKHAKQVAKLERGRNRILQQELGRLKQDFVQFLHRLDTVDKYFSSNTDGTDNVRNMEVRDSSNMQVLKLKDSLFGVEPIQMCLQNVLQKPCCRGIEASSPLRQTLQHIVPSLSLPGGICSESMSGIDSKDSKLKSLLGGSSRKMLQSSGVNSSSASFSDGQLMGSQERGAFSFTTSSKLMNTQATKSTVSGEVNRARYDGKPAVDAENSVRSPLKIGVTSKSSRPSRKRKRILHAIESIELLHSEDRKLHMQIEEKLSDLHNILNKQLDKSLEEANYAVANLRDTFEHEQFPKKRRVSQEENLGIQDLCDGGEMRKTENIGAKVHEETLGPANDLIGTAQPCTEGITDCVVCRLETMMNFEEAADGDYMKLLDLDNPADEECYRTAMEIPLSPTLPEIEFRAFDTFVINKFEPLAEERFYGGLSKERESSMPSCSYDVVDVEINSNELNRNVSRNFRDSLQFENEGPVDSFGVPGNSGNISLNGKQVGKSCDNLASEKLVVSDKCRSGDEGPKFPFASEIGLAHVDIPEHFVVLNNIKDEGSISRIFCAIRACMARCSLVALPEWILQRILLALKMEEHLHSKEKACVFLSLLLLNFSTAAWEKSSNSLNSDIILCSDSFASHVNAVLSDAEARSVFDELCLDGLLSLIEDFLMDGKVMTCTDVSSKRLGESNSKINILLDGVNTTWSSEAASAAQLVAGSIILASIAAATDCIGFIYEASYNIFRMHRCDPSLVLTVLHIFAYLGGEKIFTLRKYDLTMTVLKSIVMSFERGCLSVAANSSISYADDIQAKFHPCAECPFSKDAVSVDTSISLLLEKLQRFAKSGKVNGLFHKDQAEQNCQEPYCLLDINCGASGSLNKRKMSASQLKSVVDTTLCHVTDVLSLVELLSCIMSWDWTYARVVPELIRMLESSSMESFTIAIVILLSQLGRLGVDACGYEDKNVESLRNALSDFLWHETTSRAGFPLQIATVTALLGLLSLDFGQVIEINSTFPSMASQSAAAGSIRKWFCSLSKEHQALSFSLLQSSALVPNLR